MNKKKKSTKKFIWINLQYPSVILRMVADVWEKEDKDNPHVKSLRDNAMELRFFTCCYNEKVKPFLAEKKEWDKFVKEENERLRKKIL